MTQYKQTTRPGPDNKWLAGLNMVHRSGAVARTEILLGLYDTKCEAQQAAKREINRRNTTA